MGRQHQHRDAAVLLRAVGRAAARAGAGGDPPLDREGVREARSGGGRAQSRGGRPRARRAPPRSRSRRRRRRRSRDARSCPATAPDFVQRVTARLLEGQGDLLPVSALPPDGTFPTGTARYEKRAHRRGDPDLGSRALHRLRQVRDRLPARRDPHEGVSRGRRGRRARRLPREAVPLARAARPCAHDPGRARRLHRLRRLRRGLPGAQQERGEAQGDRHGAGGGAPRARARELRVLPRRSRSSIPRCSIPARSRTRRRASRSSSSRAPAPAAARRRI